MKINQMEELSLACSLLVLSGNWENVPFVTH